MIDDNRYEVADGEVESPSNNTRLKGTVNPTPVMGATASDFAKPHPLDAADTAGVVGIPTMGDNTGMLGSLKPSLNPKVDMKNSDTSLNTTASEENLSAKYKNPNVKQTFPAKGGTDVSFNDHS